MKFTDLIGKRFNRLIVIDRDYSKKRTYLFCKCDCGKVISITSDNLTLSRSKSCGCLRNDTKSRLIHGRAKTSEYNIWIKIKRRCMNPSDAAFGIYGGRGISVCERWAKSFEAFLEDMGERPSKNHSIDRIDCNGNYEPTNCRWTTWDVQNNNRRNNAKVEYEGGLENITQLLTRLNINRRTYYNYRDKLTLTQIINKFKKQSK